MASAQLKWKSVKREAERAAEAAREERRAALEFWAAFALLALGWGLVAALYLAKLLGWFR